MSRESLEMALLRARPALFAAIYHAADGIATLCATPDSRAPDFVRPEGTKRPSCD